MVKRRTYSACLSCMFHYFPRCNAEPEAVLVQEHFDALASSLFAAAQTHKYLVHAVDQGLFLLPRVAEEHVAHLVRVKAGRFRGHCALSAPIAVSRSCSQTSPGLRATLQPSKLYPSASLVLARCAPVALAPRRIYSTSQHICVATPDNHLRHHFGIDTGHPRGTSALGCQVVWMYSSTTVRPDSVATASVSGSVTAVQPAGRHCMNIIGTVSRLAVAA
jgi:hypothetical protein